MNTRNKKLNGEDNCYFNRLNITSLDFNEVCDCVINIKYLNGLSLVNTGNNLIEYSFNGFALHGILNPNSKYSSFLNRRINKIWFRAPDGESSVSIKSSSGYSVSFVGGSAAVDVVPDIIPPELETAEILADGWTIRLHFNESIDQLSIPSVEDFSITNTLASIASVEVGTDYVDLLLSLIVGIGETISVSYVPGVSTVKDLSNNSNTGFNNIECVNNSDVDMYRPPGYGTSLKLDLLADYYEPGETGDTLVIRDLSSNNNNAIQQITAFQPTRTIDAVDGKAGIVHTGTTEDHLYVPGISTLINGLDQPFSIGIYFKPIILNSNGAVISWGSSANATNYMMLQAPQHNSSNYQATKRAGSIDGGTTVNSTTEDDRLFLYVFDGTTGFIYINGVLQTLSDSEHAVGATLTCNTFVIGAWFSNNTLSRHWTGAWRRICIWNVSLGASEISDWNDNVENY